MERDEKDIIKVSDPPGGDIPYSVRIQRAGTLFSHPSFEGIHPNQTLAVVRNEEGIVVGALKTSRNFLKAKEKGNPDRRIALIDACDALGIPQDIVDN